MTIEEAIRERLLGLSGVTTLASTRVYILKLPQQPVYPAVRVQPVADVDLYHLRGRDRGFRTRLQVDAFSSEGSAGDPYGTVAALADAIAGDALGDGASGLSGFVGDIGGSPATVHIAMCERLDRRPLYDPDELRVVRMVQDFDIYWWEL